jgi:hypothetical protein
VSGSLPAFTIGDTVITSPSTRRTAAAPLGSGEHDCPHGSAPVVRTVTPAQVNRAVAQLRERPGRSAAEQMQAVLRALDLTVAADPAIPDQR